MKKVLLVVVLWLSFIIFAGCTTDVEPDVFFIEVIDLAGDVLMSESINFDSETQVNLIELIDEAIDLDYTVFSFGTFINGVGGHYPKEYGVTYNYYFSLFVDGVSSNVGLDQVVVQDGTKISFIEVTLLDEIDLEVDRLIELFIQTHIDTYISSSALEHHVVAAAEHLHRLGYDFPSLSVLIDDPSPFLMRDTLQNTMKTAIYETIFQKDTTMTETTLLGFSPNNHYDAYSVLTGLSLMEGYTMQKQSLITQMTSTDPAYMDSDYAGMALLAIAPYFEAFQLELVREHYLTYIKENLTSTGVTAWGNPNSSSTATVVLGLVAHGINPRGEDFQTEGIDLIEALLLYSHEGAFKWVLGDETANMSFSTPQVFAALVAYKIMRDTFGNPPFHLFDLAS